MIPITPQQFVDKWRYVTLNERSACQSHFLDLCRLANAHARLDRAVFAAYGCEDSLGDEEILERLLMLNLERAKGGAGKAPGAEEEE